MKTMKYVKLFEEFLGNGEFHTVYAINKDKVKKVGPDVFEHAKMFKKFPNEFPIVYEMLPNENAIIVERLDDKSFKKDALNYVGYDFFSYHPWDESRLDLFNGLVSKMKPKGKKIAIRIKEIINKVDMKDIHINQFGYTKNGKIKAFDY